jgi:uncharacterized membrane protein YeaQ/YmgE (transglycosylase-associated protein family)
VITFIIGLIIIGLIAGFIARALVPGKDAMSIPATIALGIIGSFVGGFLFNLLFLGHRSKGWGPAGFIGSVIGAIIVLLIYRMATHRRGAGTANRI